jgi:D-3-phosphoglycerate dehydrogenase
MSKIPVYVIDPYHDDAVAHLQQAPNIEAILWTDPAVDEWHQKAVGILVRSRRQLTADDFAKALNLKVVVKQGVGVDAIDLEAAKKHGVQVYNTPALNSEAVAELTLTMALCLARRVAEMDRAIRHGEVLVRGSKWHSISLFHKTIGIVGMGNIGREVARKFSTAMKAKLVAYDPYFPADGWHDIAHTRVHKLEELLTVSDLVTISVPLTEETRGLIGAEEIAQMKDRSILLNLARGGIVDESALLAALKSHKFWGVGLDATAVEPPTMDVYSELFEAENLIMTPHVGGDTIENQIHSGVTAMDTLLKALDGGEPIGRQA